MPKMYWLMKSEPEVFSIDDLQRVKKEPWEGVRNYQALKDNPRLEGMLVTRRGQRLSIQPVEAGHFREVCRMGGRR